jgi:DNA-binding transcriptional MerR regulator
MSHILVPLSPGELLDKITILRIKAARMAGTQLQNVRVELELLTETWRNCGCAARSLPEDEQALQAVNEKLWDIEDRIREKESAQLFDGEFIELARAVYFSNDERAAIKRRINTRLGSRLVEEKSYAPDRPRSVYSAPQ